MVPLVLLDLLDPSSPGCLLVLVVPHYQWVLFGRKNLWVLLVRQNQCSRPLPQIPSVRSYRFARSYPSALPNL